MSDGIDIEQLKESIAMWERFGPWRGEEHPGTPLTDVENMAQAARLVADGEVIAQADVDYEAGLRRAVQWLTHLEDTDTPRVRSGVLYAMVVETIDAALHLEGTE